MKTVSSCLLVMKTVMVGSRHQRYVEEKLSLKNNYMFKAILFSYSENAGCLPQGGLLKIPRGRGSQELINSIHN